MLAVIALAVSASSLLITLVLVWGVGHMVLSLDDRIDAVREAFTRRGDADTRDRETFRSQLRECRDTIGEHGVFIERHYPSDTRRLEAKADSALRNTAEVERRIAALENAGPHGDDGSSDLATTVAGLAGAAWETERTVRALVARVDKLDEMLVTVQDER